jgi:hypothetical protein
MAKYFVVHGSVGMGPSETVAIGESFELEEKKAAGLIAAGFICDEKTFLARKKKLEGALEAEEELVEKDEKLAVGLGMKAPVDPEKAKSKGGGR